MESTFSPASFTRLVHPPRCQLGIEGFAPTNDDQEIDHNSRLFVLTSNSVIQKMETWC